MDRIMRFGNTGYDNEMICNIESIRNHEFLLPFIGLNYAKYGVLQIAESRFLPNCSFSEYELGQVYESWVKGEDSLLIEHHPLNLNTREMFYRYYYGIENCHSWAFVNFCKAIEDGLGIEERSNRNVDYFAFMNYYQFPIPVFENERCNGMVYDKLKRFPHKSKEDLFLMWEKINLEATKTVNGVIDIIKPRIVFFTSADAYNHYMKYCKQIDCQSNHKPEIVKLNHSSDNRIWYGKRNNNKSSRDLMVERIKDLQQ